MRAIRTRVSRLRFALLGVAAVLGSLTAAAPVQADLTLAIADVAGSTAQGVVLHDTALPGYFFDPNNPLYFEQLAPGQIKFDTLMGQVDSHFTSISVTGQTQPALPTAAYAEMNLGGTITAAGPATLQLVLEGTGYTNGTTGSGPTPSAIFGALSATATNATVTANTYFNPTGLVPSLGLQTVFGPLSPIDAQPQAGSVGAGASSFSGSSSPTAFAFNSEQPITLLNGQAYSLLDVVRITFGQGGGTVTFGLDTQVVPEPSTMALAATGLPLAIGLALWRRRRQGRA